MGEEGDTVTELAEVSADNNVAAEDKSEAFTEKNAEKDEITEVEEESKEADEKDIENMDIDKEVVKESKADEEGKADQESKGAEEKQETKFEEVEDVANVQKEEKESPKEHEVEKGSKESDKSESGAKKKDRKRKRKVENKKDLEPKTPVASTIVRPVRQRKSVERLVASIEGELTKEIFIEKGRGTALKDIPNVAYKLSKMKADDTLKSLHTILFGRRGKAAQFKSNISQFSGFVWYENEEKQKMKVKEKLDKCVKEKLLELCDVLDIPVDKATSRKEDLESQLMDFLDAPHPTTSELLAEKDQSSKGKKREKASKKSPSSTKSRKKKNVHEPKDDQEEGLEVKANDVQERSDDEISNQAKSEEKDGKSEEKPKKDKKKHKQSSSKSLSNKEPAGEVKTKKTPSNSSKGSKKNDDNDANPKEYSKKKTTEVVKGKKSTSKKPSSKDNTGKKILNGKGHKKADKLKPSDDELRSAICEVLKEVDFNTATFSDIVKILAKRYDTDLTPRKTSVKNMIQDELTRLVDEADEEDEDENTEKDEKQDENAEKDEKQPSVGGVEA